MQVKMLRDAVVSAEKNAKAGEVIEASPYLAKALIICGAATAISKKADNKKSKASTKS